MTGFDARGLFKYLNDGLDCQRDDGLPVVPIPPSPWEGEEAYDDKDPFSTDESSTFRDTDGTLHLHTPPELITEEWREHERETERRNILLAEYHRERDAKRMARFLPPHLQHDPRVRCLCVLVMNILTALLEQIVA